MKTLFIMCIVAVFICLFVGTATSADKSLVVYLTFDEGKGNTVADVRACLKS